MSDSELRENVINELKLESHPAAIGVAVTHGVVTLTGEANSYAEKRAIEKAVKRVQGVRAIAEEITVPYEDDKEVSDTELAERAYGLLDWMGVAASHVAIKVQNGWVALSGHVDREYQRHAAESAIRRLAGVVGVVNSIFVIPPVREIDIKQKIEKSLKDKAGIEAACISVVVRGNGVVALTGTVHNGHREIVKDAARSIPGVIDVEDHLQVL